MGHPARSLMGSRYSAPQPRKYLLTRPEPPPTHLSHPEIALKRVRSDCRAEVARAEARAAAQEAKSNARIEQLESMILVMATVPKEMSNTPFGGDKSTTMALLMHAVEAGLSSAVDALLAMAQEDVLAPVEYHAAPIKISLFLLAVSKGDLALSLKFLEMGADVHDVCIVRFDLAGKTWFQSEGATALQLAAACGSYQLVEELVSRGAILAGTDIMVPDTEEGHQIVQFLQSRGSNQCTRFTPEKVTGASNSLQELDSMHILKQGDALGRLMGPDLRKPAAIKGKLGIHPLDTILYDAEKDGWAVADFHRCCDNKGATLLLMRTTGGEVIGAFTRVSWNGAGKWIRDNDAFLFEITADGDLVKCKVKADKPGQINGAKNAIFNQSCLGPVFGSGHDLKIETSPNTTDCTVNVANTYDTAAAGFLRAGARTFKLEEFVAVAVI